MSGENHTSSSKAARVPRVMSSSRSTFSPITGFTSPYAKRILDDGLPYVDVSAPIDDPVWAVVAARALARAYKQRIHDHNMQTAADFLSEGFLLHQMTQRSFDPTRGTTYFTYIVGAAQFEVRKKLKMKMRRQDVIRRDNLKGNSRAAQIRLREEARIRTNGRMRSQEEWEEGDRQATHRLIAAVDARLRFVYNLSPTLTFSEVLMECVTRECPNGFRDNVRTILLALGSSILSLNGAIQDRPSMKVVRSALTLKEIVESLGLPYRPTVAALYHARQRIKKTARITVGKRGITVLPLNDSTDGNSTPQNRSLPRETA